jgi:hypothetical protein
MENNFKFVYKITKLHRELDDIIIHYLVRNKFNYLKRKLKNFYYNKKYYVNLWNIGYSDILLKLNYHETFKYGVKHNFLSICDQECLNSKLRYDIGHTNVSSLIFAVFILNNIIMCHGAKVISKLNLKLNHVYIDNDYDYNIINCDNSEYNKYYTLATKNKN